MAFGLERPHELPPVVGAELDQLTVGIREQVEAEHDEEGRHLPYEDYTPQWLALTTAPLLANGKVAGRFCRRGRMIDVWIRWQAGSDTTFGTGPWEFTLPVRPRHAENAFVVSLEDRNVGILLGGVARNPESGNADGIRVRPHTSSDGIAVDFNSPFTWAVDDVLVIQGTYEAYGDE